MSNLKNHKKLPEALQSASLVIADTNSARRNVLKRLACEVGFQPERIFCAQDAETALAYAVESDAAYAIVDDSVGYASLARLQGFFDDRRSRGELSLLFFISEVAAKGVVGRMAEEEVDEFIFRPFSSPKFKEIFTQAAEKKLNPSPEVQFLHQGRVHLAAGALEDAKRQFENGLGNANARSATFCYFLGQVALRQKRFDEATKHFETGLKMNNAHFRCLQGMFEVRMAQERIDEAYLALKHLCDAYPENPERFSLMIKMAVAGAHYRDMERFDKLFEPMILKNAALTKAVAAGHAVLGRSLCVQKNLQPALKALARSIELSDQGKYFVDYAIESLEKYEYRSDAEVFRKKYSSESSKKAA